MRKSETSEFTISAVVTAKSLEEAETVASERFGYDEDYGFEYLIGDTSVTLKEATSQ